VVLAPPTAARLARESAPLPEPWPEEARQLFVRLLGAGRGLLLIWETLEATGALARILPEWERLRLLPHASIIHRFTVDRHVIETCIEASALLDRVARPDVLLVTALLHDIGKGGLVEHSIAGEPIAREIALRIGYDERSAELVAHLVRWHLLLAVTATTRDPGDPATIALMVDCVRDTEELSLLTALTEADARATSPKAWSTWRAQLIGDLSRRVAGVIDAGTAPPELAYPEVEVPDAARGGAVAFWAEQTDEPSEGSRMWVLGPDRVGLLADVAATFAMQRVPVRACRAWSQGRYAVSVWELAENRVDPTVLRHRFEAIEAGRVDVAARLGATGAGEPSVVVRPEASAQATVLEVRTLDRPGLLSAVCRALAALDIVVRSAHISTLGPQAVDVFYLQEASAGALGDTRAASAAHAVRAALTG
ncbi:MAG: ACT domain-containing protein, partial [Nocardioides sp.]|uniref:ACT domain-containing protein n=1 Tax=Nocardioides sp. TaxID=35761 RepID=UPI0039E49DC8